MNDEILHRFETYCPNNECGDPIVGIHGEIIYTRRRMNYVGRSFFGSWIFACPVCSRKRKFRESYFGNSICEE